MWLAGFWGSVNARLYKWEHSREVIGEALAPRPVSFWKGGGAAGKKTEPKGGEKGVFQVDPKKNMVETSECSRFKDPGRAKTPVWTSLRGLVGALRLF